MFFLSARALGVLCDFTFNLLSLSQKKNCVFQGLAEVFINFAEELKHTEPIRCVLFTEIVLTFETRIHRLEWFAQVILISVTPMLQNLRIGLKKRRNGKSDVP